MNDRNGENLRELLKRFFSDKEAEDYIEDLARMKRILDENPAPEPSEELIWGINHRIAEELRLRKEHSFRRFAYKLAPVAAVFVVFAAVGVRMLKEGSGPVELVNGRGPIISASVWESDNVAADDRNLLVLTTELDELEVEFTTLESEENGGNGRSAITELEIEFAEINRNIWEG
jgi:hypothetical protein